MSHAPGSTFWGSDGEAADQRVKWPPPSGDVKRVCSDVLGENQGRGCMCFTVRELFVAAQGGQGEIDIPAMSHVEGE
eukprot:6060067-Alexandrium_andersonii.AAC.1